VSDLSFDDPCILFCLRRESRPFFREFHPQQRFPGAPCWARFCGPSWLTVLVLETGVGTVCSEKALNWLLAEPALGNVPYRPKLVLAAGFAGALHPERQVGDVILATEAVDTDGKSWPVTWPGTLPAGEWRPPLHRGRILTAARLIASPDEKQALGRQFDAVAVDMETATLARLCSRRGVPFGCVRAVSDDCHTRLSPQIPALLSGGRLSPVRLVATLARYPGLTLDLWRLAKQTLLASQQLARALGELLTLTLPFGAEL
jgi:nucleoside phosphorylase